MCSRSKVAISPTWSCSEDYSTTRHRVNPVTRQKLADIGVRDDSRIVREEFPDMPPVSKGWKENSAFFKGEGGPENRQINIGLGDGRALNTFNENIQGFRKLR